jgi:hypothetical protein
MDGEDFLRLLRSVDRFSESAICLALLPLNTAGWRSSALLSRVTCADQRLRVECLFESAAIST